MSGRFISSRDVSAASFARNSMSSKTRCVVCGSGRMDGYGQVGIKLKGD